MLRRFFVLTFLCAACAPPLLRAQVAPSATGSLPHLWAGAYYSYFNPGFKLSPLSSNDTALTYDNLPGYGFFGDYYLHGRYGIEAEGQLLNLNKPLGLTEKSVMGGPTATLYRHHRVSVSAKLLAGVGFINYGPAFGYGSYFDFAPRGDLEYRFSPRLKLRGGYEYQFLPSAPGLPASEFAPYGLKPPSGVSPHGVSVGASYRIF